MTTYTPPIADMGFVMAEVAGGDISDIIANIFFANLPVELMEEAGWLTIPLFYRQAPTRGRGRGVGWRHGRHGPAGCRRWRARARSARLGFRYPPRG